MDTKVRDACIAALDGKQVLEAETGNSARSTWRFSPTCQYSVEPQNIEVNGFNVPKPMDTKPSDGEAYFVASTSAAGFYVIMTWEDDDFDNLYMQRRVAHSSKEAAIAHAKAMLGIDPNSEV